MLNRSHLTWNRNQLLINQSYLRWRVCRRIRYHTQHSAQLCRFVQSLCWIGANTIRSRCIIVASLLRCSILYLHRNVYFLFQMNRNSKTTIQKRESTGIMFTTSYRRMEHVCPHWKKNYNRWARMFTKMLVFCVLLLSMRYKMYVHVWKLRLIDVNTVRPKAFTFTNTDWRE